MILGKNKYMLFYKGLASTPNSVGLKNITTKEIVCEISTDKPSGKETRAKAKRVISFLKKKYGSLLE